MYVFLQYIFYKSNTVPGKALGTYCIFKVNTFFLVQDRLEETDFYSNKPLRCSLQDQLLYLLDHKREVQIPNQQNR